MPPFPLRLLALVHLLMVLLCTAAPALAEDTPQRTLVLAATNTPESPVTASVTAVLRQALGELGWQLVVEQMPTARSIREVAAGRVDGHLVRIDDFLATNPNPDLTRVEEWVAQVETCAFTKLPDFKVMGWTGLRHYRVLYFKGLVMDELGLMAGGVPESQRIPMYFIDDAFRALEAGTGDLLLCNPYSGLAALKRLNLADGSIRLVRPALDSRLLYTYLNVRHAQLARRLSAILRRMKDDGSFDTIVNPFFEQE